MLSRADLTGSVGLTSALTSYQLEEIIKDYKFSPATLAFKLENRKVQPGMPLRWYPSPHLMFISLKIAMGIAKGNARIIVSAPPRHGKSKISTIHTPVWGLERFPEYHFVLATYGADLSMDFGRDVMGLINDNSDLLSVRLHEDVQRAAKFMTDVGGAMTSVGLGGPITGRGADVLIIDDYIKEIKEAMSPAYKEYLWNWFVTTAMTRLEPNASVIIVATRWVDDDLIGQIVKNFPGEWEYICLPAIAEEDDPLGREPGEALFPERYDEKALNERKRLLGSLWFDAIYQQKPHPAGGKLGNRNWVLPIDKVPEQATLKLLRIWDLASTPGGGDPTTGGLLGLDTQTNNVYLLNVIRKHLGPAGVEDLVYNTAEVEGKQTAICIEREPGSSGKIVAENYINNVLRGFTVSDFYSNEHKVVRAQPFLAAAEAGRFYMLKADWNEEFLKEFESFPDAEHDDQIDVCAIGYAKFIGKIHLPATFGRRSRLRHAIEEARAQRLKTEAPNIVQAPQTRSYGKIFRTIRGGSFGRQKRGG